MLSSHITSAYKLLLWLLLSYALKHQEAWYIVKSISEKHSAACRIDTLVLMQDTAYF
jgi:hypothetical protein